MNTSVLVVNEHKFEILLIAHELVFPNGYLVGYEKYDLANQDNLSNPFHLPYTHKPYNVVLSVGVSLFSADGKSFCSIRYHVWFQSIVESPRSMYVDSTVSLASGIWDFRYSPI